MGALEMIKKTMDKHGMVRLDDSKVVVGFSGGPDSACLLHCLWRVLGSGRLYAAHVNHQLRGEDADRDMEAACDFCGRLGIPFFVCCADVRGIAAEAGLSEEDAGRRVRYGLFERVRATIEQAGEIGWTDSLAINGWTKGTNDRLIYKGSAAELMEAAHGGKSGRCLIAVAQNANDQAETVLMRLIRGTGIAGLGAMEYVRSDGIIRPLLDVTREEVEAYCAQLGLEPRIDNTNLEMEYTRNRIRLELIPYLREHFNPNIIETLNRLAAVAREESSFIDDQADELVDQLLKHEDGRRLNAIYCSKRCGSSSEGPRPSINIPVSDLKGQPKALRHRVYFNVFGRLGLEKNIAAVHIEQADFIIENCKETATAEFPQGYRMSISHGRAEFWRQPIIDCAPEDAVKENIFELEIQTLTAEDARRSGEHGRSGVSNRTGELNGGSESVVHGESKAPGALRKAVEISDLYTKEAAVRLFDAKAIRSFPAAPVLRTRRPGDFIRPLGMNGRSKKLQDFFVDKKVPRDERDRVLLVCLGREVVWVAGTEEELASDKKNGSSRAYGTIGEPFRVRDDTKELLLMKIVVKPGTKK